MGANRPECSFVAPYSSKPNYITMLKATDTMVNSVFTLLGNSVLLAEHVPPRQKWLADVITFSSVCRTEVWEMGKLEPHNHSLFPGVIPLLQASSASAKTIVLIK